MHKPTVKQLLSLYDEYKNAMSSAHMYQARLAKARLLGQETQQIEHDLKTAERAAEAISDAMTFATPLVWIEYKYRAYQNEAQPIVTLHDLRVHCSKEDYICTKRFTFLNDQLVRKNNASLSSSAYSASLSLADLLRNKELRAMSIDPEFAKSWDAYEYHTDSRGKPAKWMNYPTVAQ